MTSESPPFRPLFPLLPSPHKFKRIIKEAKLAALGNTANALKRYHIFSSEYLELYNFPKNGPENFLENLPENGEKRKNIPELFC